MSRFGRLATWWLCFLCIGSCIVFAGCGGNGDDNFSQGDRTFHFVFETWHFDNGQVTVTTLTEEVPILAQGEQFSLTVIDEQTGQPVVPADIKEISFFKSEAPSQPFLPFTTVISWPDPTVGTFYRIDQQFPSEMFCVTGKVCGRFPITPKNFQVICAADR